jgi:hypothetical protein
MAHVVLRKPQLILQDNATLRRVPRVTLVKLGSGPRGLLGSSHGSKQVLFRSARHEDDDEPWGEEISVRIINPKTGVIQRGEVVEGLHRRKKQSKSLRPLERFIRKMARRQAETAQTYLARHQRSNRLRKNGWIKDLYKNVVRSVRNHD